MVMMMVKVKRLAMRWAMAMVMPTVTHSATAMPTVTHSASAMDLHLVMATG
jgi:hypothetical protein